MSEPRNTPLRPPAKVHPMPEPTLADVVAELRAIRKLLEHPLDTAARETRGEVIDPMLGYGEKL